MVVFTKDLKEGEVSGFGVCKMRNGDVYKGMFEGGNRDGEGVVYRTNGDVFHGTWIFGKREEFGKYMYGSKGDVYIGHFIIDNEFYRYDSEASDLHNYFMRKSKKENKCGRDGFGGYKYNKSADVYIGEWKS